MSADRNLLFGILALQLNFVTRDQLVEGMNKWVLDKTKSLGQIFVGLKAMDDDQFKLLDALVDKHVEKNGGNVQRSIEQLSTIDPHATQQLRAINDSDLQATVGFISTSNVDPHATQPLQQASKRSASRFRIIRPHARGGLGEVFLAQDTELSREVALKEIQGPYADNIDSRERFLREAEITGNLEHPGIVPVYGLGQYADGRPFYAMRFIKGDTLKDAIDRFHAKHRGAKDFTTGEIGVKFRQLLGRIIDVCQAIEYAHSRGVLHRDLKPGNIILGKYGETLVVDWGLAKVIGRAEQHLSSGETTLTPDVSGASPTQMGSAIGTPSFMSPEQAAGDHDALGPSSDVYSLGATLYCLLTGEAPFASSSQHLAQLLERIKRGEFRRPSEVNASIPSSLEAVCLKAMSSLAGDRYASPVMFADDIEHWLADEPVSCMKEPISVRAQRWVRRHKTWAISGVFACSLIAVVLSYGTSIYFAHRSFVYHLTEAHKNFAERERVLREIIDRNEQK